MIRYRYGIVLLILASLAFLGAFLPLLMKDQSATINLGAALAYLEPAARGQLAENYPLDTLMACQVDLTTRWPERLRTGLAGGIEQSLRLTCPAGLPDGQIKASARIDEGGQVITPDGEIELLIRSNQPAEFVWRVQSDQSAAWQGTTWTSLFFPVPGGEPVELVLSSLQIQGTTDAFLGLPQRSLVTMGWIFAGLGTAWLGVTRVLQHLKDHKTTQYDI